MGVTILKPSCNLDTVKDGEVEYLHGYLTNQCRV